MSMTLQEVDEVMSRPEYANRVAVIVREDGDEFVTEWEGQEFRWGNMLGLDSSLTDAGVPAPRNVFLVEGDAV